MKVLLLSTRPLGAADIDRVLLAGFSPAAVDVCPSVNLALTRLDLFRPDLIIVNLPEPEASDAVTRLRERGVRIPTVTVAPADALPSSRGEAFPRTAPGRAGPEATSLSREPDALDVLTRDGVPSDEHHDGPSVDVRIVDAALNEARHDLDQLARGSVADALDAETRWLLYEVASIGHVSTTPAGEILASNDIAAQLLGHFSPSALEAAGVMPVALLDAAGAFGQRPSRFELCLQHGADGPLHWLVGLALPQGGSPATVTWFLIDVSEQRLQARRARFLRRMEALTHVLSAATAECTTLLDTGSRALTVARDTLPGDVDVDQAIQALSRTQAVLGQLAGFARRRARRPGLRDLRALIEQIGGVLVHATGDDVTWSMHTGAEPLYVSVDAAEFEQCLAAIVTQGREALPLGGHMQLELTPVMHEDVGRGRGTRPDVRVVVDVQGYGLQPVATPPPLQTLVMRLGTELVVEQRDHLTTRISLSLPRVFLTGTPADDADAC